MIPAGYCQCGCGEKTNIAPQTHKRRKWIKGQPVRFIKAHYGKGNGNISDITKKNMSISQRKRFTNISDHPSWKGGRHFDSGGYVLVHYPSHPNALKSKYVFEHVLIASKILNRPLKKNEVVHHINFNPSDNRNNNLLICSASFHKYLHGKINCNLHL